MELGTTDIFEVWGIPAVGSDSRPWLANDFTTLDAALAYRDDMGPRMRLPLVIVRQRTTRQLLEIAHEIIPL